MQDSSKTALPPFVLLLHRNGGGMMPPDTNSLHSGEGRRTKVARIGQ